MVNKKLILLTAIAATSSLLSMEMDQELAAQVDRIIASAQEASRPGAECVNDPFGRQQTVLAKALIPHIVRNPNSLAAVLNRIGDARFSLRNKVECMVIVDDQAVLVKSRMPALVQLLRAKEAAGELNLPNPELDIFEERRSPGTRALSFTKYLKQTVSLAQFPDLAEFIARYEAQRATYNRLNAQVFADEQREQELDRCANFDFAMGVLRRQQGN